MNVGIHIERTLELAVPYAQVLPLLNDLEGTIRRFPKLRKLTKLEDNAYLWELQPIGSKIARISHEVVYAVRYTVDPARGEIRWSPLRQHGNASIEGSFRFIDEGAQTKLSFRVAGELRDVPVPLLYRLAAGPFIQGRFTYLVDQFLERTAEAVQGRSSSRAAA